MATLVEVLATPSSSVQTAVSACLTPLMPGLAADPAFTDGLVQTMLKRLLQGQSYGDRWATAPRPAPCLQRLLRPLPCRACRACVTRVLWAVFVTIHCLTCRRCRRGAALGLAGIVKGLGISAINGYGILDALKAAMDDQGNAGAREGALLALECLCASLGRRALGACVVTPQPRADAPACRPCAIRA